MRIQNDDLWDELWNAIVAVRDSYPRVWNDAPTDEIVFEVFQILSRRGLTGHPPAE